MNKIQELRNKFEEITRKRQALIDEADKREGEAKGSFTPEERTQFDTMNAEAEKISAELKDAEADEARRAKVAADRAHMEGTEQRSLYSRAPATRNGEAETESEEYRQAFDAYLRGDERAKHTLRALNTTAQGGGNIVPKTMYSEIIKQMNEASALRKVANIVTLGGSSVIPVEADIKGGVSANEGANIAADANTIFEQRQVAFKKIAYRVDVSRELAEDTSFDIQDFITKRASKVLAIREETTLLDATAGFVKDVTVGTTTAANNAITSNELVNFQEGVNEAYHAGASWLLSQSFRGAIRNLKDTAGRPLYDEGLAEGPRGGLLGNPVFATSGLPAFAANRVVALFGDMSYVVLGVARDLTLVVDPYTRADYDEVRYIFTMRTSATLTNKNAVKALKVKA